jgi:hypothetical protein
MRGVRAGVHAIHFSQAQKSPAEQGFLQTGGE